jgi:hypothetical protein
MENIDSLRKQMKEYEERRLPNPFGEQNLVEDLL